MAKKKGKTPTETVVELTPQKVYKDKNGVNIDGWQNVFTGLGFYNRDKKEGAGFRQCKYFYQWELDELYRSDGLARVIIDTVADEMVRQGWDIEGDPDGSINGAIETLNGYTVIADLIKWSRLYGGALIVMGIDDGRDLAEPVDFRTMRSINWLRVFDRYQASSADGTFNPDLNSPNYGYPEVYLITDSRTGLVFYAHYTRVLRMDWNILPPRYTNWNDGWGDPLMQSIYAELRNYQTLFGNVATMTYDFVTKILKVGNLSELVASQCSDQIVQRVNLLNQTTGMTNTAIIDTEESLEKHSTSVAGLPEVIDRFMLSLSAVTGIPVSLLYGRAPAGLNATGDNDVRNFYDRVKQYQESKLRPVLEKLVTYLFLCKDGPTRGKEPDDWSIAFVPLWQNTQEQEALIRRTVAETDAIYMDRGVLDPAEVLVSRFGGGTWSMNTEVDLEARKGGYNPEEEAELEREKEEKVPPSPTIGPDFIPSNIGGGRYVGINSMDGEYTEADRKREKALINMLKKEGLYGQD